VLQDSQALTAPPGVTLEVLAPQARVKGI